MKRRDKPDRRGRNGNRVGSAGAVIILRRSFWHSPQVSALGPLARSLIVELTGMYTGPRCHERLFLSVKDAARRLGVTDLGAASSAINELLDLGFITETVPSHFAIKAGGRSRARAFRLNWKDADGGQVGPDVLPGLDFTALTAKQKRRVASRSEALAAFTKTDLPVLDSRTLSDLRADMGTDSVRESNTLTPKIGGNALGAVVRDSHMYISYQGVRGRRCQSCLNIYLPKHVADRQCSKACEQIAVDRHVLKQDGWWAKIEPLLDRIAA